MLGPGTIKIRSTKNRWRFSGRYRTGAGRYLDRSLRRINRVFGAPYAKPEARISLRLIEVLARLRRELKGGWIVVSSGYRSPSFNKKLRAKGRTVAKASLHQYGMAADLRMVGVKSKALWTLARARKVGGAGFYGSPWVHIDVGPPRAWTQSTANVRKGLSNYNKRIIVVPRYDRYRASETMIARFARMTAYPIGVKPRWALERLDGEHWRPASTVRARLGKSTDKDKGCPRFTRLDQMAAVRVPLPAVVRPGIYRLGVSFCGPTHPGMPKTVTSYMFQLTR